MRIPLIFRYARREILLWSGIFAALALAAWLFVHPLAAIPQLLLLAFVLNFFRDPERTPEGGLETLVSPADGVVTDITDVDDPDLEEPCVRVGIFLSVFNVHINRAPTKARVAFQRHLPGRYVNAMKSEASTVNEANVIGFEPEGRRAPRFVVKQIAGAIARRIVWDLHVGDSVERGERIGMIKFGSRTELILPKASRATILVKVGQKVRGGATAVARLDD